MRMTQTMPKESPNSEELRACVQASWGAVPSCAVARGWWGRGRIALQPGPPCPGQGTQFPCRPGGHAAQRGCWQSPFPAPASQLQGASPSRLWGAPGTRSRATSPEDVSRGVRPKELGAGLRLWLPPRMYCRVFTASEGALGRHSPSPSSPGG